MRRKSSTITLTDQFCGAGGSGQGAKKALDKVGGELKLALNHWKLATETYNTNFPSTSVDCTDISACDPRRYPSTDILITSPECTTHSPAGGNNHKQLKKQMDLFNSGKIDPATERSRATMWDVCRFAEYHRYNVIIVENVVEAKTRWPLFDNWLSAMHTLGYDHRCLYHNSMHHLPTPQSRDRMYVVFWRRGNRPPNLEFTPQSYCGKCEKNVESIQTWKRPDVKWGKYRQQYVYCCPTCTSVVEPYYYASFNCIDWTDKGQRIGDRSKPLKPKTIARIEYGRKKYNGIPFQVMVAYGGTTRGVTRGIDDPLYSQSTTVGQGIIRTPFIINNQHSTGVGFRVRGSGEQLPTLQTTHQLNLVSPPMIVSNYTPGYSKPASEPLGSVTCSDSHGLFTPPLIIKGEHDIEGYSRTLSEPMMTQTTRQTMYLVTQPFLTEMHTGGHTKPVTRELNAITAGGIKNGIVTSDSWNSFIAQYYGGSHCVNHITEEIGTIRTAQSSALVSYSEPALEDCYYRMLKAGEVKLGMAFDSGYIILGNSKDQVKQCGNAVTPPAMEWIVGRCIESLVA